MLILCDNSFALDGNNVTRIVLKEGGASFWLNVGWEKIAIDDNGNIYALHSATIHKYDDGGNKIDEISMPVHGKSIEVFGSGDVFYLQSNKDYLVSGEGKIIKEVNGVYGPIIRTCGDSFVYSGSNKIFDSNFDKKRYFNDQNNYSYEISDRFLTKRDSHNKVVLRKELSGFYKLLGIDNMGNLIVKYDSYTYAKLSNIGDEIDVVNLPPQVITPYQFYEKDYSELPPDMATDEPFMQYKMNCKGDVYIIHSFSEYPSGAKQRWMDGREYFLYKISFGTKIADGIKNISEAFKSNKYDADRRTYKLEDLEAPKDIPETTVEMYYKALRNEIFARHGRVFKSEDLRTIFENTDWYKPNPNYSDKMLNDIEKKNVQFILDYEKKMGWR